MAKTKAQNSLKNSRRADHLKAHRFAPGQSGNPGGRPRGTTQFAELIATETRDGAEMVEYALKVLRSKRGKPDAKRWAVEYLTERMLGKPPQAIDLGGNIDVTEQGDAKNKLRERFQALISALRVSELHGGAAPEAGTRSQG